MIRVKNLRKNYGDFQALKNISFDIKKGEIVGLLGPNGAGKTTTMKILTCYMSATSGEVVVDGHDIMDDTLVIRSKIGYLPESAPLYMDMSVYEYLEYAAEMHNIPARQKAKKIKKVVSECGLQEKLYNNISQLSKGYKQRVGLAQALIHEPEILILDEPTTGLDPNQILEIRKLIKKIGEKKTVILSTHILSEVEATCDRVIIINKGKIIAADTPKGLQSKASGKIKLTVKIEGSDAKKAESMLSKIEGIETVEIGKSNEPKTSLLLIETTKGIDLRSTINHTLLDNKIELLEMNQEAVSLENIFRELTS